MVAECLAANPASARVLEKCGLKPEGRLVAHVLRGATYEDIVLFGTDPFFNDAVEHEVGPDSTTQRSVVTNTPATVAKKYGTSPAAPA